MRRRIRRRKGRKEGRKKEGREGRKRKKNCSQPTSPGVRTLKGWSVEVSTFC